MKKQKYSIEFSPAYPPYQLKDEWQVVLKVDCAIPCGIVKFKANSKKECEKYLKEINK